MEHTTKMDEKNPKDKVQTAPANLARVLSESLPPAIEDPAEYEALVNSLPPEQREFATYATRFAKLWEYLSERNIEMPSEVIEAMRDLSKLPHEERIALLDRINEALLEYECDSEDIEFRQ